MSCVDMYLEKEAMNPKENREWYMEGEGRNVINPNLKKMNQRNKLSTVGNWKK